MFEVKPVPPQLDYFGQARVALAPPLMIGPNLMAERRIIPITGGRFEGAALRGAILPGGADWQIVMADGTALLEARYTIETDDGALVYIRNRGVRYGPPAVLNAIAQGELVDPAHYYFRTTPVFEVGDPRYAWLNRQVAVCSGARSHDTVIIDFYMVR
jgi:hypothetical protein